MRDPFPGEVARDDHHDDGVEEEHRQHLADRPSGFGIVAVESPNLLRSKMRFSDGGGMAAVLRHGICPILLSRIFWLPCLALSKCSAGPNPNGWRQGIRKSRVSSMWPRIPRTEMESQRVPSGKRAISIAGGIWSLEGLEDIRPAPTFSGFCRGLSSDWGSTLLGNYGLRPGLPTVTESGFPKTRMPAGSIVVACSCNKFCKRYSA